MATMRMRADQRAINTKALADDAVAMLLDLKAWQLRDLDGRRSKNNRTLAVRLQRVLPSTSLLRQGNHHRTQYRRGRPTHGQYELCQAHVGQVAERERAMGREIVNRGGVGR